MVAIPGGALWCVEYRPAYARIVSGDSPQMQKPRRKAAVFATRKEERKNEKDGR